LKSKKIYKKLGGLLLLLLSFIQLSFAQTDKARDNIDVGLYFHSFLVDKDNRTGLDLTPEKPLSLSGGFTLMFDFKLRRERDIYGYIFRIVGDRTTNIDLISNIDKDNLVLVAENTTLLDFGTSEIQGNAKAGGWITTELTVDTDSSKLKITFNGHQKSATYDISHLKDFNICFGRNNNSDFATTDVAPFILKDVKIFDNRKRLVRHWKLDKHGNGRVYDERKSAKAVATNTAWEINHRAEWEKRATVAVKGKFPQVAFDKEHKRVFIVKDDLIHIYDARRNRTDTLRARQGIPFNLEVNQLEYDSTSNQLIMYNFVQNRLGRFDFATREWDNADDVLALSHYMHHNKYFDAETQTVYAWGGYGFHKYSALLQSFSDTAQRWESADLSDVIHPRYLSSMGMWNDSLLLCFGGYGNASGKQYESPHNYYDLYAINPRTLDVSKIWELSDIDKHFTNGNSLIVDKANQTFYTLSYQNGVFETQIFLHEYSLQAPGFRKLGNPIPFLFNDVESYCDLFIPSDSSALFAVTSHMEGNDSRIEIYSISYPPLGMADTLQPESETAVSLWMWCCAILVVIMLILVYAVIKRIRKMIQIKSVLKIIESNKEAAKIADSEAKVVLYPAVNLLDIFEVLDSKNINISYLFTPTISQIFLLLYFRTLDDGKGIMSNELQKILWPDKDYESARNNRNVYFNKLRLILSTVGNIQLCKMNEFWVLLYDNELVHSDYEQIIRNMARLKRQTDLDKELLKATLRIAGKGKLLPFLEVEWMDNYKTGYVNTLIEFLMDLTDHKDVKNDLPLLLNIAEMVLLQDSIEESAIKLKCGILFKLGKKKQALQCYTKYVEEYLNILNIKPELTFDEIVK
jgi:hypothetical protein